MWGRIGPKAIYKRLLALAIFTQPNENAFTSMKKANFAEAIRIISLDNANL